MSGSALAGNLAFILDDVAPRLIHSESERVAMSKGVTSS